MFESDADRLAMIRALGGVVISTSFGTLEGLFEADFVPVGDTALVESFGPKVTVRSSDAKSARIEQGLEIRLDGTAYVVRGIQPDGAGMITLLLEAA